MLSIIDAMIVSVFSPRGSHQRVKLVRAPLSRWRCKKRHKDLSWFGQEKALLPAGGEKFLLSCT